MASSGAEVGGFSLPPLGASSIIIYSYITFILLLLFVVVVVVVVVVVYVLYRSRNGAAPRGRVPQRPGRLHRHAEHQVRRQEPLRVRREQGPADEELGGKQSR